MLAAIGFLALGLVIWLLGPFIAFADYHVLESASARLVTILILLVLGLGLILLRQLNKRRAERNLLDAMGTEAGAEGASVPSQAEQARAEEEQILKDRFEEAIKLLRQPKNRTDGKVASLYDLPWYIIIGPPGCGKTTALANSGIDFPLANELGQHSIGGIGGTRNCDWWISNEAVLIDTAGRYTTQDSEPETDHAAWLRFLDLLKRYRRRRPINGALISFSVSDLITLDEATMASHCRAIRKRLQELSERVGISIPIYLLLTKADLVAGFSQYFDDLGREERLQVWGMTFPLELQPGQYAERFGEEFDLLLQRLNNRLNLRLISERDYQRRAMILAFPQQVASLKEPLQRFVADVFQGSRFERPVMLRGVYLSSGTQEGTPIDRIMGSMAAAFGLDRSVAASARSAGKSYFITNLLRKVIFRESLLAGSDRKAERLRTWMQRGAYVAVVLLTVAAGSLWAMSFTANKAFTADLEARLEQFQDINAEPIESATQYSEILPRLNALRAILDHVEETTDSPPFAMRLGLYQGSGVAAATRDAYARALNAMLVPGIASQLEEQLASSSDDASLSFELLKLYLMLVNPERMDDSLMTAWAAADWAKQFPRESRLRARLEEHLAALLDYGVEPIDPNRRLVKQVREKLEQQPLAELVYGRLKFAPAVRDASPLSFQDIAGRNADTVFNISSVDPTALEIPALFTYRGFYQLFQPQSLLIIGRLRDEAWVYGAEESPIIAGQLNHIEESVLGFYIDEYIRRWDNFLGQLNIRSFPDLKQAIAVTGQLIRPDSPLKRVLDTLHSNTELARLPKGSEPAAELALEALRRQNYYLSRIVGEASRSGLADAADFPPKRVEHHFSQLTQLVSGGSSSGISVADLQRNLTDLYSRLSAIEPASGLSENPFSTFGASGQPDIFHELRTEAARLPEPVRRWIRQIVSGAQSVALGNAGQQINEIYRSSVAPICKQLTTNRYPFNPRATRDISVYDFGKLFAEDGILNLFFSEHLSAFVNTNDETWRWRQTAKKNFGVSDASLVEFQRASVIREAFFPEGGKLPSVRFSLIPSRLDPNTEQFSISFGGQTFAFSPPRPSPVDGAWPGTTISNQVSLAVTLKPTQPPEDMFAIDAQRPVLEPQRRASEGERFEQHYSGQWAFFRMVNPGSRHNGVDRFRQTFTVNGARQSFEIQAFSALSPFGLAATTQFKCPETL
ncbi:MAG: type VI secretion system membrane subunit TssM [Lamprobacter sp.]|uniref:type VI secretion system membrane subunit TssM n=1 Tax=Lamprobacter sp. TaxID=3100796 RepID=UPI002B25C2B9|nr:type VI secretion system membrane subunit TssM [Lamprobacter sp.]MEA3640544.1 type VI secretion system membrane subunit TssM [Lamprobacter sp.]